MIPLKNSFAECTGPKEFPLQTYKCKSVYELFKCWPGIIVQKSWGKLGYEAVNATTSINPNTKLQTIPTYTNVQILI